MTDPVAPGDEIVPLVEVVAQALAGTDESFAVADWREAAQRVVAAIEAAEPHDFMVDSNEWPAWASVYHSGREMAYEAMNRERRDASKHLARALDAEAEVERLLERDALAQPLIGLLRLRCVEHGDDAGGPDFPMYRRYKATSLIGRPT